MFKFFKNLGATGNANYEAARQSVHKDLKIQRLQQEVDDLKAARRSMTCDLNWLEGKVEPVARMLAAEKMGLTKDVYGETQPYELWSQYIPEARKQLGLE